jgi:transcriptional regulator with XRE-family HTH domain
MNEYESEHITTLPGPMQAHDQARRKVIQVEIGRRLRACRRRRGLSLRRIAEEVGISVQMVGKYEHGLSSPYISVLHGMCGVLGVTVPELLEGIDVDQPRQGAWPAGILRVGDRDAVERLALFDLFERIPDNVLRRLLLKTVAHLAETSQPWQGAEPPAA